MSIKKVISGLMLGSLLFTTGLTLAEETTNQVTVFDRVRDIGFAGVSGAATVAANFATTVVKDEFHSFKHPFPMLLAASGASLLLPPTAALCAAKAASNQTWKEIVQNKKGALAKYYAAAALTGILGYSSFLGLPESYPTPYGYHKVKNIQYLPSIGLGAAGLVPGSYAAKYLKEVLTTKPTS